MRFLVDAQLPERVIRQLIDALHTARLSDGNRTADQVVARIADEQDRVVVSKDRDFRDSHLLRRTPRRLLVVSTGNISNDELLALFHEHLAAIVDAFENAGLVELRSGELVTHDDE